MHFCATGRRLLADDDQGFRRAVGSWTQVEQRVSGWSIGHGLRLEGRAGLSTVACKASGFHLQCAGMLRPGAGKLIDVHAQQVIGYR